MTEPADLQPENVTRAPARFNLMERRLGWLNLRSRAWWIVAGYAIFAALWIYFSDRALGSWVTNPDLLMRWSVYKGLVFVIVTSLLLLVMLRQVFGDIETGYAALKAQETERRQAERAARSEKQFSDAMIESLPGILYFYDSSGRFLRWNKNFERVSGGPRVAGSGVVARHADHCRDFLCHGGGPREGAGQRLLRLH